MSRTLETIFRHPLQLILMFLIPIVAGLAIAYTLPRSYESSATLWAVHRYETIGATGPESDLSSTPAQTQVAALLELIQTRQFALTVANSTHLAASLKLSSAPSKARLTEDALVLEIAKHVSVTATGSNVYLISYTNSDPQVVTPVILAVIKQFQLQGGSFSVSYGQQLLQGDQAQLSLAKKTADADTYAEQQYLATHPALTQSGAVRLDDPQYAQLEARRQQSETLVQNLQSAIATLNQEIAAQNAGINSFFRVLDPPLTPDAAVSRTKTLLAGGGVGAGVALLVYLIYIVVLVRRDRALYSSRDLQKITGYPVLMQLPQFSLATIRTVLPEEA